MDSVAWKPPWDTDEVGPRPVTDQPGEPDTGDRGTAKTAPDDTATEEGDRLRAVGVHSEDPGTSAAVLPRRRIALIAAAVFAVMMAAMWIWILFIYDPGRLIDELPDTAFPTAAEKICADAVAEISELPPAQSTNDPVERAAVIDDANTALSLMVSQLAPIAPSAPPESAEAVHEWLDDWATHIGDRESYADALRSDPEARFTETPKGTKQISRAIDGFAEVNRMPSCATTGDV